MCASAGHKALSTMLEIFTMSLQHESLLLLRKLTWLVKRAFLQAQYNAPKMHFHSKRENSALDPSFYWPRTMCYYRVFFMLWFILQQCWQITAKPSSSLQSVWLSHCSTIDSVMLPCDPLPRLHCRSGEGLMSFAFWNAPGRTHSRCGRRDKDARLENEMGRFESVSWITERLLLCKARLGFQWVL